jgi:hypothetical protein
LFLQPAQNPNLILFRKYSLLYLNRCPFN